MKSKKLVKRLSLSKTTIANLWDTEKEAVKGGATAPSCGQGTCPCVDTEGEFCPTSYYPC